MVSQLTCKPVLNSLEQDSVLRKTAYYMVCKLLATSYKLDCQHVLYWAVQIFKPSKKIESTARTLITNHTAVHCYTTTYIQGNLLPLRQATNTKL